MLELRAGRPMWLGSQLIQSAEFPLWRQEILNTSPSPAALELLRLAQLLPQVRVLQPDTGDEVRWLHLAPAMVDAYHTLAAETLQEIARANLPTRYTENARIVAFRPRYGMAEHIAVLIGQPEQQEAPLVRVHSSCLTGDLLGSLRCDCGDQLHLALEQMAAEGHGILCYLQQEGRGIGIGNKIRAYALQEAGQDTAEANEHLGFAVDARDFGIARAMLKLLGVSSIRLLTNNPGKLDALSAQGLEIKARVPLKATPHSHNAAYLETKAHKMRHHL